MAWSLARLLIRLIWQSFPQIPRSFSIRRTSLRLVLFLFLTANLHNTRANAALVSNTFKKLGFNVVLIKDASKPSTE